MKALHQIFLKVLRKSRWKWTPIWSGFVCEIRQLFLIFDIKLENGWILKELYIILSGKFVFSQKRTLTYFLKIYLQDFTILYMKTGNYKYPELLLIEFCWRCLFIKNWDNLGQNVLTNYCFVLSWKLIHSFLLFYYTELVDH